MNPLQLSTPSLYPALSLLMLAYTNRFLGLASVVRALHGHWQQTREPLLPEQIHSLRRRIRIIKNMQTAGVISLILCIVSMTFVFYDMQTAGVWLFCRACSSCSPR